MPLLIDCYNVLHADMPPELAGLDERGLGVALEKSGMSRTGVVVVCDGRPKPHSPSPDEAGDVEFIYSGPSRSADAVIIERIERNSAPRRLTVVTDDRELAAAVRRRRARVIGAGAFIARLALSLRSPRGRGTGPRSAGKPQAPLSSYQVADWLRRFGYADELSEDEIPWWDRWEDEH